MSSPEIEWRRLRADQLREMARADAMVILPLGAIEQHGPHLPVEVDARLGEEVALRTARVMAARDICRSVLRHGFRRIVLLNGHGGNENGLRVITDELTPKLGVPIVEFTYWYAAAEAIAGILETQKGLLHACEAETAMMMAVRPELVAEDRIGMAKVNYTGDVEDVVGGGVYRWRAIGARSSSGVIGNPDAASPAKGARLFDAISATLADKLGNPALWDLPWDAERVT